jgi:benzoate-CoA ligase family protein
MGSAIRTEAPPAPSLDIPDTFNLASALVDAHVEAGRGDRPAIRSQGNTYSYADVARATNRFGNALRGLGVEIEDRVAMIVLDSPEFVASFFGAIKIGAVPIPMSTMLKPADYRYMLTDSRAKTLVVSEPLLAQVAGIRNDLRSLRHVVVIGGTHEGTLSFGELSAAASTELEPEPTSKDDMCFWLYSSGTTGFPKGAVHLQHDAIVTADLYARRVLDIGERDRTFSVAKLFFAYGLGNALTFPFRVGATTILFPGRPEPKAVYEVITRERPTLFYSVPTNYAALLNVPERDFPYDLSSIRLCVSAGEALPRALYDRWKKRFGLDILDGIGSTEVLHIFISNFPGRIRPGTSGQLVPGYEATIVDEEGRPLPVGEVGNLWIKGDSTCAFYWNKHEKTKQTIRGEWIVTGDKYTVDEDGYFTYAGRSDDMLKVGGIWVSPIEVESALIEHPAVLETAVVGREDADELLKPMAYVVLKDATAAGDALVEELQAFVKDRLAHYKCPRWIAFVPELPKTATGKIQRYRLRERAPATDG